MDEHSQSSQINFVDWGIIISDDKSLSKEVRKFFNATVKNLDVKWPQVYHVNEGSNPFNIALNKYACHLSIFKIKKYFN